MRAFNGQGVRQSGTSVASIGPEFGEPLDEAELHEIHAAASMLYGERRLQAEMLTCAIRDLLPRPKPLSNDTIRRRARRDRASAIIWIKADDWEYELSFVNCCKSMKIDAGALRGVYAPIWNDPNALMEMPIFYKSGNRKGNPGNRQAKGKRPPRSNPGSRRQASDDRLVVGSRGRPGSPIQRPASHASHGVQSTRTRPPRSPHAVESVNTSKKYSPGGATPPNRNL